MGLRDDLIQRLALLGEIESTQTALFHEQAAATYGLGVRDMKALSILLNDGPQSAGALVEHLGVTSGAVTGVVDRLIAAGVARRSPDPADRRRVIIEADQAGLASRPNIYEHIGAAFGRLYATYTDDQLQFLVAHSEAAIEITRSETSALGASA